MKEQELFDRVNNTVLNILGVSMTFADFQKYANALPDERDLNSHTQKNVTRVLTRVLLFWLWLLTVWFDLFFSPYLLHEWREWDAVIIYGQHNRTNYR